MAYGMKRDSYSPVEVTLHKTGDNHYTLPHTYSCTQQLRLLRYMLLREEDGSLVVAQGVPSAWLEPSKRIEVTDAPTLFGPVSYRIETHESKSATIHLDPPTRTTPSEIRIHLRHPQRRKIAEVKGAEDAKFTVEGDVIRLSKRAEPVDLHVTFAEAP